MIKIIYDPHDLASPQENKLREITKFPQVVKNCLSSLSEGQNESIFLVQPVLLQWFKNMSTRYPQGAFVFETLDARAVLSQRWGVDIPTTVMNDEIQQAGLLALDLQPQPGFSFEDFLLAHFFAPIFTAKTFPFAQVPVLLEAVDAKKWQENQARPLLARTLHNRLEEWQSKTHSSEQRQLVEWVAEDPGGLKRQLMQYRVLRSYPALGEALLGAAYSIFNLLKLPLQDLVIDEAQIADTVVQVTYFLNNQSPANLEQWVGLLAGVSGLLPVEFETLEKHLLAHPDWLTPGLVDQIEQKFESLSHRVSHRLAALRSLVRPPRPDFPELNWDVDQMLAWATESYLPYQAWCSAQAQFDPELFLIGDRFSEWLVAHWFAVHANSKRMVFNILPDQAAELKQAGRFNLILVVDNLGWSLSAILRDLFQERGYFLSTAEPYLAMLPTETEISKKCLLAGAVGYQALDDKSYQGLLEKGWVPYFKDQAFRYLSDIGSLGKLEAVDSAALVVNYLAVDKALHQSADQLGMPHPAHVRHLLEMLVESTLAFIDKHGLRESIRIHVVSDHGSTRIPVELPNDLDPAFFKSNGFEVRSQRFVAVSDERFVQLADNLKLDCFFLPAQDFLNPTNFICARRANRFVPVDQKDYVHGGLLPEEVVVPYLRFERAVTPLQDLTVLVLKNEFRYRMETLELEIGNPNDMAVEHIRVSVLNSNVECEPLLIPELNGKKNLPCAMPARFKLTNLPEDQTSLRLRLRFRARGEQHSLDKSFVINMKKLVEVKSTSVFDD